jgi:hypothetical protein
LATSFPQDLDTLINPNSTDTLAAPSHSEQHSNANDAIEALQAKVGTDNSTDSDSLDYRIAQLETGGGQIGVELGIAGNNDLTVTGIENPTAIDEFASTLYRTVKYMLQISRGSEFHTSELLMLQDGTNFNIVESNIISNSDSNLANVYFEENSGIISLVVDPVTTEVTARYFRTSIKK